MRCLASHKALKARLKKISYHEVPKYYSFGTRKLNILHTKLRLQCSNLNADKFAIGISNDNLCHCGEIENSEHFLLECGSNLVSKVKMLDSITDILANKGLGDMLNIDLLLKGSDRLSLNENKLIFGHVQTFIAESKRFV